MRARWRLLFWISLLALAATSWTSDRLGVSLLGLWTVPFLGMVVAAAIAFAAMVRDIREAWPAGAVLVASLPMALDLFRALPHLGAFYDEVGIAGVMFVAFAIATVVTAVVILVMPAPKPPPDEPIARAEIR